MTDKAKQEEFLSLFEPVRDKLSRYSRAMTLNSDEAKDLASETILIAYENFDKIREKKAFLSFLFTIASRLYKTKLKKKKYFSKYDGDLSELYCYNHTQIEYNYDIHVLYKILNLLPRKTHEAVVLFEISGFSLDEIKKIQGGTLSGVKSRIRRGREKLKELINDNHEIHKFSELKINGKTNGLQSSVKANNLMFSVDKLNKQ